MYNNQVTAQHDGVFVVRYESDCFGKKTRSTFVWSL